MILLVTPIERASACVAALHQATSENVVIAESLVRATTLLRAECFLAVILDQYLLETEPDEAGTMMEHLGFAVLVQVNLAISSMERLTREVQAALQRRKREEMKARQVAMGKLHCELSGTLTSLLLSTELAIETPCLPSAAAEKLHSVHEQVKQLRKQLEIAALIGERAPN